MELLNDLWLLIGLALLLLVFVTIIILIPVYGLAVLYSNWHDKLLRDDAEYFLHSELTELQGWTPDKIKLERFTKKELVSSNQAGYNTEILEGFIRYLLANSKKESSLVIGTSDARIDILWLRFRWEGEWWIMWYDTARAAKHKRAFRAFPESCMENEVYQEVGYITDMRTIPYVKVSNYFR